MRRTFVRAAVAVAAASACACSSFQALYPSATNRAMFADKTYSTDPPKEIESDVAMQLFAHLQLETSGRFYSPAGAAACLNALDGCYLAGLGEKLAMTTSIDAWALDLRKETLPAACDANLDARDRTMMRYVVGRIATVTEAIAENSVRTRFDRSVVFDRAAAALALLAPIVAKTPAPPAGSDEDLVNAPALALSGGSANGAYTAGFLFELLSARERVLHAMPEKERIALDRKERFGAIAGTSVGSLISQVLDLYFVDESQPITEAQHRALEDCVGWWKTRKDEPTAKSAGCFDGWPEKQMTGPVPATDMRLPQACALTKLFRYFTDVDEGQLMCVERGSITQMLGALGQARPNMMRFDPMQTNIIDPVLHDFGPLLLNNSTTRVVVSVQMEQSQAVGLDERACMLAADPWECLGSGVMASVVLPFFARPVRAVTTGFSSRGHDCGTWFDGGLRSGFPVFRAIRMTRPLEVGSPKARVLAISTSRFFDLPSDRLINLMDVAMNAVGQMADQNFLSEPRIAQQSEELRQRAWAILQTGKVPPAADVVSDEAKHSRMPESFQSVITVYVPTETPPQIVAESGYSFDRYVMRGLFVWGRREAIRRLWIGKEDPAQRDVEPLSERLGFKETLGDKAQPFVIDDARALRPWSRVYSLPECAPHRKDRMTAGHDRVSSETGVSWCADVNTKEAPSYFSCPVAK